MLDYRIEAGRIVAVTATGQITLDEIDAFWRRLAEDPDFRPSQHLLVDIRETSLSELAPDTMRAIASRSVLADAARRAYVVSDDLQMVMAKMLATFVEIAHPGRQLQLFQDPEQARTWLLTGDEPGDRLPGAMPCANRTSKA